MKNSLFDPVLKIKGIGPKIKKKLEEKNNPNAEELALKGIRKLKKGIYDLIIKSLCIATPHVSHLIKTCQPEDIEN